MLAIDTNVIVRYLTGDHPTQSPRAKAVIDQQDVFVCTTVVLETECVLRSAYGFAPARIAATLRGFAGLPHVTLEDPTLTARALDQAEKRMDLADALHLTKASGCDALISFGRRFARAAHDLGGIPVRAP